MLNTEEINCENIKSKSINTLELYCKTTELVTINFEDGKCDNLVTNSIESDKIKVNDIQNENLFSNNLSFNYGNGHTLDVSNKINCNIVKRARKDLIRTKSTKSNTFSICYINEKINNLTDYIEYISDNTEGDSINILVNGIYSINACFQNSTFSVTSWIDKNNSPSIDINSSPEGNILTWSPKTNNPDTSVNWIGYLEKGDIIRIKSTVPSNVLTSVHGTLNINLLYEC